MLFVVCLIALVIYAVLYVVWEMTQNQVQVTAMPLLRALNNALFMPDNLVFVIFRGLILLTLFYVIADFFLTSAKRGLRRRQNREQKALMPTYRETNSHIYRDESAIP
jgi:uncharacterized metal-binding protein